ncbi:MAG: kinase/pyrophosphorylase [Bdellovibrionales bacterium]|jgi:[pyruvate, water dikinase]-phosphate phosphotransferase / [pyruvate, water dikinase] kinase|nr:kinase/pyrophosphorylase [Bdellovibrionales bacterium]
MMSSNRKLKVIIISDGTGETATAITRAIMTQFSDKDVYFTRYKNVRTEEQIKSIFTEAAIHHDLIIYTVVESHLRDYIGELSRTKHVRALDLIGPALTTFANYFEQDPSLKPGLLHVVNEEYYSRVAAMEFTLNHDDGKNIDTLDLADIILVGISRTSKTPLSIYLSLNGIKVVNIPLVLGTEIPKDLFKVDQRKIVALTIDPTALIEIRKNRLTRLGANQHNGDYADHSKVLTELEWANQLFKENKRWPVFNVTDRALEEIAADILKLINMRKNNIFKQKK